PIPRQPAPAQVEPSGDLENPGRRFGFVPAQLAADLGDEPGFAILVTAVARQRRFRETTRQLEVIRQLAQVRRDGRGRPEVRDEQRVAAPALDAPQAVGPRLQIDVRRRCRRQHISPGLEADPGRVAYENYTRVAAEEADVV